MDDLDEIAADEVEQIAEHGHRRGVLVPNQQVLIHQLDA